MRENRLADGDRMSAGALGTKSPSPAVLAELAVLREFIDFVNLQVGVYCDCLAGFQGNKVRIEHQVARVNRPTSRRIEDGQPVIVWASVEDPTRPDIVHHRIIRADEFVKVNSEAQFNEQQICWSIIVFLFAYWDEGVRPKVAKIRGVATNDVQVNALGDLRLLRKGIVHNGGAISGTDHAKLKVLSHICKADQKLAFTHDEMHAIFVSVKNAIASLILEHTGHLPEAPKAEDVVGIAISTHKHH